jgi:hypothetical protein
MSITISNIASPIYSNQSNTSIDLQLTTTEYGTITCTVIANDNIVYKLADNLANSTINTITNSMLFFNANNGIYGSVASYIPKILPRIYTFLEFMALFTILEQNAIVNSVDTQIKLFLLMATGSGGLQLNNSEVIAGINYAVSINLLTSARGTQILAGQIPT